MSRAGRDVHILIVDDHPDNVDLLKDRLEARGYSTLTAHDGEEALAAVAAADPMPDLILLDIMLPKMSGLDVARRIKADKDLPFIPIIMQTALDSTQDKVDGLDAGADDYITKPINFAELEARVRSLLRIKALQDEVERQSRELGAMNDRLLRISQTDALTEIDNRRYLEQRLGETFDHGRRMHEPFACVMCDLDKFKSVNDTHGHQAGDEVLRQLATLLKAAAREIDRVGRYGGEEFMLILPGASAEAAVTFAERVRKSVEEHTFAFDGGSVHRTISCGVASWPHPRITDVDALVRAADDALYVAKETGRNLVIRFDSPEFLAHTANGEQRRHDDTGRRPGARPGASHAQDPDRGTAARA
jgi:diguanylate cyclase (GGDEF)-like protein